MEIAIFEPEAAGHHMALHVRFILRTALEKGWKVHLVTTERAIAHPAYQIVERESGGKYEVWKMPDQETNASDGDIKRVTDQFARWKCYAKGYRDLSEKVKIDAIYMVNLDQIDMAMAVKGSPFGKTPFSGMLIGRHFHCPAMGVKMEKLKLRDRIMGPVFFRMLRMRTLKKVAILDEPLTQFVSRSSAKERAKVEYVPDVASLEKPETPPTLRKDLGIPDDAFVVLSYGALSARKGVVELVEGLAHPDCPKNAVLLLAGRQDEFSKDYLSQEKAQSLRAEGRLFELNKFLDEAEESASFFSADAVWLGYRNWYGMSGVLVQGAAAGKPLIAMDQGLVAWLVEHHDLGLTVSIASPAEVAKGVKTLIDRPEDRQRFSANGLRMAAHHTPENFGANICRLIESAATG